MPAAIVRTKQIYNSSFIEKRINLILFSLMHILPFFAIYTGTKSIDWVVCGILYFIRMFAVTGFYHRYFSHPTFKTNRFFQFIFAFMAETSGQKGALWWASHHRLHHKYSDTIKDIHSPRQKGFWYSHVGWWIGSDHNKTNYRLIKDYAKYPELVFLDKWHILPITVLGFAVYFAGGMSMLLIGFFLSTVLLYHGTFTINSLTHVYGRKRYETGDDSRNSLILALITLGEGWHNNHHQYRHSTRQGFFWWEIDITYYLLKIFSLFRIINSLKKIPEHIKYSYKKDNPILVNDVSSTNGTYSKQGSTKEINVIKSNKLNLI